MLTIRQQNIKIETLLLAEEIDAEIFKKIEYFDSTAAISDEVITPFTRALKRENYQPKIIGGCVVLKRCARCRKYDSTIYLKNGREIELCPLCDRS